MVNAFQVYQSDIPVISEVGRGRPLISWERKVEQYVKAKVAGEVRALEEAKIACNDRET